MMRKTKQNKSRNNQASFFLGVFWTLFFIAHLVIAFWISWFLLAKWDFGYALGYHLIDSEEHIAEFAPLNLYKKGFDAASPDDHIRLFGEINHAVHNHGKGLRDIVYITSEQKKESLLHEAEVIHLQDVANLIDTFYLVAASSLGLFILLMALAKLKKIPIPAPRKIIFGFIAGLVILTIIILLIGAKKVFYWAHTVVFPPENQWFFYYQESLMTTLMKAPDLFAFIALLLLIGFIAIWIISFIGIKKLLQHHK